MLFERAERAVPVAGQRGQELLRCLHRRRAQPVPHPAPLPRLGRHQADVGEQGQVLGDRLTEVLQRRAFTRLGRGQLEKETENWERLSAAISQVVRLEEA